MKLRLLYLLLSLLSFSVQASPLKISAPIKNVTTGFNMMVIAPSNPNVLYGMNYAQDTYTTPYIYRSTDAGQHWQEIPITIFFNKLMVSPTNPFVLYALSGVYAISGSIAYKYAEMRYTNLFKSEDGGETWQAALSDAEHAQNCPPSPPIGYSCLWFDIVGIDRSNELTLYGSRSQYFGVEAFLKKSVDGGKTWKNIIPEQPAGSHSLLLSNDGYIDPSHISYKTVIDNSTIIYDSNDAGATWKKLEFSPPTQLQYDGALQYENLSQLWLSSQGTTNIMYATKSSGTLLKSNDYGVTWQRILPQAGSNEGLLGISPTDSNTLYATTGAIGNLMRSKDAGNTWENLTFPDTTATIGTFLFSPINAKEIYVSTNNPHDASGVYKSFDGGDTWEILKTGLNTNLRIISRIPTIQKDTVIVQLSNYEFYRTVDGGGSFTKINFPSSGYFSIITSKNKASTLYARSSFEWVELYRSDDLGETWQRISPWESRSYLEFLPYNLGFFQSSDGKTLYSSKITDNPDSYRYEYHYWYYSEDFGNTWQSISSPTPTPLFTLTIHPSNPNIFYGIGFYAIGCSSFRSTDKGQTWQSIQLNLAENMDCTEDYNLLSDPYDANILYLFVHDINDGTHSSGYRSVDAGVTWNPIKVPSDSPRWTIISSQFDPKTGFLYLTDQHGVTYRSTDGSNTWIELKNLPVRNPGYSPNPIMITQNGLYLVVSEASVSTYRSIDNGDSWQWVSSASSGGQVDHLYNRFFMFNELNKGRLGIFTPDEQAIANPQSTISDAQGYSYPSSRDGVKTLVDASPTTNKQLSQNTDTQITATFSPSAEYQNQSAELLIVSQFQPQGSDQSYWFMQSNNTWQTWDGSEANLKPAKTVSSLQTTETLDIFTGKPLGLSGISTIYTGYRIPSQGVMVSNKNTPLVLKVE